MHIGMVAFSDLSFDYRIYREATCLGRAGHAVSIVAPDFGRGIPDWEGIDIRPVPTDPGTSLRLAYPRFWIRAYRLLVRMGADAYHAHDLDSLWPAARAARRRDAALVYDSHECWIEQSSLVGRPLVRSFWARLERRLVPQVDRTITVSSSIVRWFGEQYGLEEVALVRNLPPYRAPVPSQRIRTELGLDPNRAVVLYQGGFLTENGLAEQILAAAGLAGAALVLIGDGPCEAELRALVAREGLEEQVYFIPRVPFGELHSYTCSADVGLCLIKGTGRSFYYSMPNKLFEYLMAGLPVLASDFPEMRAVIDESSAGQVADPRDVPGIRRCLADLLSDPDRRSEYRHAALEAARNYNWEREAPTLTRLYDEL